MDTYLIDKKVFMRELMAEFTASVLDSIEEGQDANFEDHFDFIKSCLETFIER
jgi:hypothetical protein